MYGEIKCCPNAKNFLKRKGENKTERLKYVAQGSWKIKLKDNMYTAKLVTVNNYQNPKVSIEFMM